MKQDSSEIIIFKSIDDKTKIDCRFEGETLWLTQAQIVELYQSSKSNVSEHISNILLEGELDENSVVRNFRTTAIDGKIITQDTTVLMLSLPLATV